MLGFAVMMSSITSAAALSRAFGGDYLSEFVDLPTVIVGLVIVGAIALVNFRGIGESAKLNVAFTMIELGGLLLVLLIGVAFVAGGDGDPGRAFEFKQNSDSIPFLVLAGASLAFYALIGFEDSVNIAEEAQDTRRAYPRAIFGGLLIGGVIYTCGLDRRLDGGADGQARGLRRAAARGGQARPAGGGHQALRGDRAVRARQHDPDQPDHRLAAALRHGRGGRGPGGLPARAPRPPDADRGDRLHDRRRDVPDRDRRPRGARRHDGDAAADRVHRRQRGRARQPPRPGRPRPLPRAERRSP